MKRTTWLAAACLLGGLMVVTVTSGLRGPARAEGAAAPVANALDVVINEVAWMGTAASYNDEWIELYNNTDQDINLTGWSIVAADGTPSISLSGVISAHGYFLLERTDDTNVNDVPADQIYTGAMGNDPAESLTLYDDVNQVIDTANGDGGVWPAGDNSAKRTMERTDPAAPAADVNWCTNDGVTRNGHDAGGNPINGTPKAQNSCYQPLPSVADLKIVKTGPATVHAGNIITYRVALSNTGVITATAVRVTDTLPTAVGFVTQTSSFSFSQPGGALVWEVGNVPTGTRYLITITGHVSDTASGTFTNHVTATTSASETATANNSDSWVTTVTAPDQADLFVVKAGPDMIAPGSLITYHVTLGNAGLATATAVRVTDTLPIAVEFVAQTSPFPFTHAGRDLAWVLGDVPTGSTHLITITGHVAGTAVFTLTNHVTATTSTSETVTANNSDSWETAIGPTGEHHVLISAVLYDGYQSDDVDEAVQLINIGDAPADLDGWELCKGTSSGLRCRALPSAILSPTGRTWLARDAAAFSVSFGFPPDYQLDSWLLFGLSNSGDEVILRNARGHVADALVYEDGNTAIVGWNNAHGTIQPYSVDRAEGQVLYRIPDETSGLPTVDTNTAADWIQYTGNVTYGRRVLYPGWDLDPLFWPLTITEAATVVVGITPDNGFDVLSQTIARAQHTISVEVYSLRHPDIITALVQKAREGVSVTVLLEGGQAGVSSDDLRWQQELWACQQIEVAGGQCWFMIHENVGADNIFNRYYYVHAKFLVVDGEWVAIGSQNFTNSSMPSDDKSNGTYGSRGVVVATNAPSLVSRAAEVFARDLDPANHNDVLRWNTAYTGQYGPPDPAYAPVLTCPDHTTYTVRFPAPLTVSGDLGFELFTAPEAALRQSDALLGLVSQAGVSDTVYVEQMYEHVDWGDNPTDDPNLRLQAIIAAARRGATVRILLNGGTFDQLFYQNTNTNTVVYVNQIASAEALDLEAAIGDPTEYGIHNKMVLVWLNGEGGYAHVGSINGSEGSNKINREMALQIQSDDVYDYLACVFRVDWRLAHPVFLPLAMRNYTPPEPPVEYVVISEVYYAGWVDTEWAEIYNPTDQAIVLSSYKIGDAEAAERFEGMYQFPPGTMIPAQGVLVVAFDGSQVLQADFEISNTSDTPDMVKHASWGTGDWTLRNDGDQVLLLGPTDKAVDVVVWGDVTYPGVTPHPGVSVFTHSLERYPAYYDTDDCAFDFRDRFPPGPGTLPE